MIALLIEILEGILIGVLPLAVAIGVFLGCCFLDYVIEKIRRFLSNGDF